MSDDQIADLMNSVFDSDDESAYENDGDNHLDPDYSYTADMLTPEDDEMISEILRRTDGDLGQVENLSLDLSTLTAASEGSVTISTPDIITKSINSTSKVITAETSTPDIAAAERETNSETSRPSTLIENITSSSSKKSTFKPVKRPRSPLPAIEATGPQIVPSAGGFTLPALDMIDKNSTEFAKILWRNNSMRLHVNEVAFRGNTALPDEVKNLKTPMDYFCYFFTDELIDLIVLETNRNACSENINNPFNVDAVQIRKYIGVLLLMAIFRYPNMESHWGEFGFRQIPECMPLKKFEKIKKYLCFSNEADRIKKGEVGYDPLFRIRKVANILNERFDTVPKNARLCVDEQMCSTKMVHHLRQYMPNKPHKWGIKLFVLCDTSGYSYQFEIYNGAGDNVIMPGTPDLGATSNIVIRLSQTIPNFKSHIIYFDNFYTSLPLLVYLRARGIFSLGTIRSNRIPNSKLPLDTDPQMKNADRGHAVEYMGSAYGVNLTTVLWKDTKNVRLCSTYVGVQSFEKSNVDTQIRVAKTARYDKKKKKYIEVDYPQIIREYNSHMGGVDLMDSYMGRNGLRIKTMDATMRIFHHLLDMAVTNAFILYRRSTAEDSAKDEKENLPKTMRLHQFRVKIAQGLCAFSQKRPVGRPSLEPQPEIRAAVGKKTAHPVEDIRYDGMDHVPEWMQGRKKTCKHCKKSETHTFCPKCQLNLCYSGSKNCWKDYHTRH